MLGHTLLGVARDGLSFLLIVRFRHVLEAAHTHEATAEKIEVAHEWMLA